MATTMASSASSIAVNLHEQNKYMKPNHAHVDSGSAGYVRMRQRGPSIFTEGVRVIPEGVRVVTAAEYKEAAACLAEAFAEDDVARYFIDVPDRTQWTEKEKWDLHVEILEYVTYAHIMKGLVTTIGDFEAVALWMPPGKNMDDYWTTLRSGMWRLNYRLSGEGKRRFFNEFLPLLHDTKASALGVHDDNSWYLVYIGTKPSAQGRGHCRKLIEHVTKQADAQGQVTYLESSNERNPAIYRRFGFETVRTVHLQRGEKNVSMDIMVREPARAEK